MITDEELRSLIDVTSKSKFSGSNFIPGSFELGDNDANFRDFNSPGLPKIKDKPLMMQRLRKFGRRISEKKLLLKCDINNINNEHFHSMSPRKLNKNKYLQPIMRNSI